MTTLATTPFRNEEAWLKAIGKVIWCMGQLEYLTYIWCFKLEGASLRDAAIDKRGFGGRYDLVVAAIGRSPWPAAKKEQTLKLWEKAKCFAGFRNKVAHAPVVVVRGAAVLLDARQLRGPTGQKPVRIYKPEFLESVAHRIQRLAQALDAVINAPLPSTPDN